MILIHLSLQRLSYFQTRKGLKQQAVQKVACVNIVYKENNGLLKR